MFLVVIHGSFQHTAYCFAFLFYSTYLYIRDDLCRPLHSYLVLPSAYIIVHIIAAHSLLTKRERKPFRPLTTMYSPLQFVYHQPTYNKDTHHEDTTSLYWNKASSHRCRPATVAVCSSSWFSCLIAFQTVIWSFRCAGIAPLHPWYHQEKHVSSLCFVFLLFQRFSVYITRRPLFFPLSTGTRPWSREHILLSLLITSSISQLSPRPVAM